nr:cyclodeaminase/cyclohydrolase family protein [uncultured Catonella sp.]
MRDLSLNEFSEKLFSKEAVPGGGGASALVGALAISLGAMAANLTLGKKKYEEYSSDLERIIKKADKLRIHLLKLIEEDGEAYNEVSKAYKIKPRDKEVLEKALVIAATPPLNMMKAIKEVIELLDELSDKTSVLVVSDVGTGAKLAGAALGSAYLNVVVNTGLMKDTVQAKELDGRALNLSYYQKKSEEIYKKVLEKLTDKK